MLALTTNVNKPQRVLLRRIAYAIALFISSAGALVIEIVAGRMLAPYVGMSLYTWTAVIAVVLAGLSAGHWIGGELSGGSRARSCSVLAIALLLTAATAASSLLLIRMLSPLILGAGINPIGAIVLLSACLFFLPSLFVGLVSPILTKLAIDEAAPHARGRVIGQMYALGAIGSIAGTLAAGYVFISWIGSIGTVTAVAATYALLAIPFVFAGTLGGRTATVVAMVSLSLLAAGTVVGQRVAAFTSPCTDESDYYCIRVIDYTFEAGRPSALMVLDHLGHGINDRDDPRLLHSSYLALIDRMQRQRADAQGTFSAFFIGGGAFTLPRAWSVAYPRAQLVVAEIDPAVTRVARKHMWLHEAANLSIRHRDARLLLQSLPPKRQFDIIVGDAFHDISVPPHLVTREFAQELRKRLKPHGIYTLAVVDHTRQPLFLLSAVRTLQQVFADVEVWADVEQLSVGGRVTFVVRAAAEGSPDGRIEGDERTWLRWPGDRLAQAIVSTAVPLLTDDYAPVDRLMLSVLQEAL
jgi:spermidine synthase